MKNRLIGAQTIDLFGDDLIVGCMFGSVARIDAHTGALLAKIDTGLDGIEKIERLGACAYGISGFTGGAIMQSLSSIIRCDKLQAILAPQEALTILGMLGNDVVLDDEACDVTESNCPDKISVLDLRTGKRSASRSVTESEPAGSGMVVDGHLYLFLGRDRPILKMFDAYDYGDPRAPLLQPRKVIDNIINGYQAFDATVAGMQTPGDTTSMRAVIFSLNSGKATTLWSSANLTDIDAVRLVTNGDTGEPLAIAFNRSQGPDLFLRLRDYKELIPDRPCSAINVTDQRLILNCVTTKFVNRRYVTYLAAYRW